MHATSTACVPRTCVEGRLVHIYHLRSRCQRTGSSLERSGLLVGPCSWEDIWTRKRMLVCTVVVSLACLRQLRGAACQCTAIRYKEVAHIKTVTGYQLHECYTYATHRITTRRMVATTAHSKLACPPMRHADGIFQLVLHVTAKHCKSAHPRISGQPFSFTRAPLALAYTTRPVTTSPT